MAPDAWGDFDGGPAGPRGPGVVHGAIRVARNLLYYWGPPATLVTSPVAGQPALLGFSGRDLAGLLVFTMHGDQIQAVHVIADPRQLGFLSAQLGLADYFPSAVSSLPVPSPSAKEGGRK